MYGKRMNLNYEALVLSILGTSDGKYPTVEESFNYLAGSKILPVEEIVKKQKSKQNYV